MNLHARPEGLVPLAADLFASPPQALGFAPDVVVRAFLVRSEEGNLLINASEGAVRAAEAIEALGGATELWLGHWHEGFAGAAALAERLGARVVVHQADREAAEREVRIAETFDGPRRVRSNLEAIPIPGHTPGSVAYLWHGPEARCLFTADSLYVSDGTLKGAVLDSSDRTAFLASLARLRSVEFDLLIPWAARKGAPIATPYDPPAFRRDIDALIARVEAGADG